MRVKKTSESESSSASKTQQMTSKPIGAVSLGSAYWVPEF